MKKVLFVCTGNIFRSLTAQKIFELFLKDRNIKGWEVTSAGTHARKAEIRPELVSALREAGVKSIQHKQRKVNKKMLDRADAVICMAEEHINFLEKEFGFKGAKLFNEIANEDSSSVKDIDTKIYRDNAYNEKLKNEIKKTVGHINSSIPGLFSSLSDRYFLFTDFVSGKRLHRNGFPFVVLSETKNAVAFMSIDIPKNSDGHFLVIPKKRYVDFYKIPKYILNEMFTVMAAVGKVLDETHDGFNILLNNGAKAGQYIFHSHFHLIPRKKGDGIKIEVWKKDKISKEDFLKMNQDFKKLIEEDV